MPFIKRHALDTGWEFKIEPRNLPDHVRLAQPARFYDGCPDLWLPVQTVPTEIHVDLLKHGIIPDPHKDFNELSVRWVADTAWTYRCRFASPPAERFTDSSRMDLVFKGLDTFATVYLNDAKILESDNMFIEHRLNVTWLLRQRQQLGGANELVVVFDSARKRGLQLVKEHPEHRFIAHQTEVSRTPVRKAQYQWGWDWGPILVTCGPWKPVMLETYQARIDEFRPSYALSEDLTEAHVKVTVVVRGPAARSTALLPVTVGELGSNTVNVSQLGYHDSAGDEEMDEDDRKVFVYELKIKDPALWWPRGYGPQTLHVLGATLFSAHDDDPTAAEVLDEDCRQVGFRRAELVTAPDAKGESFFFRINGVDVFCGGSCWIPADSFLTRVKFPQYQKWVKLVADGNQNMIRVWGGGIYEDDALFKECDKMGILVWQDFAFACANYPAYPTFLKSVETEARQNVRRLRDHPSLVIWAGNNEDYQVMERWGLKYDFNGDKDPASWLRTDFPARYIYEYLLPTVLVEESPGTVVYRPSSPWGNGNSSTLKVDPTVGDVHQWEVWHGGMRPYQHLPTMGGRFVSEFGMEAYPHVTTLEGAVTDSAQRMPGSMAMDFRNKAVGHLRRMLTYVGENVDLHANPGFYSIEAFAYLTQVVQADALRTAYTSWRRQWGNPGSRPCGGVLAWQLNDCWPTVSWSMVDFHGVRKPAWWAVRDAMQPVKVNVTTKFWDCTTRPADGGDWIRETGHVDPRKAWPRPGLQGVEVWVANSTGTEIQGASVSVVWYSVRTGEVVCQSGTEKFTIGANGTTGVPGPWLTDALFDKVDGPWKWQPARGNETWHPFKDYHAEEPFDPDKEVPTVVCAFLTLPTERGGRDGTHDAAWPSPLKYLPFQDRGVVVEDQGEAKAKEDSVSGGFVVGRRLLVSALRPVKCFVFQEHPGMEVDKNAFDVMPDMPVSVVVRGCDLKELKWTYLGQETQEEVVGGMEQRERGDEGETSMKRQKRLA